MAATRGEAVGSTASLQVVPGVGPEIADDFAAFYRSQFSEVVRLVGSVVERRDVAEEITQDAFVIAYDRWARICTYDRPGDFVRRVALNRAYSHFRRRGAESRALQRVVDADALRSAPPNPPSIDDLLWVAVRKLPPRQAQVVALTYVDDLPVRRVAEVLDCGENTVKTHLKRARHTLAQVLHELSGPPTEEDHDSTSR